MKKLTDLTKEELIDLIVRERDAVYSEAKTLEQHRAEFEKWADSSNLSIAHSAINDDDYANWDTIVAWLAWLAARGVKE